MKIRATQKAITITGIYNEGMMEQINSMAAGSGCSTTFTDFGTKCKITGSVDQLNQFINLWNEG